MQYLRCSHRKNKSKCTKAAVPWEITAVCEHVTKQYHNKEQSKWLKI